MLNTIKKIYKKLRIKYNKFFVKFVSNTYSQAGEDVILKFLFESIGITHPSYLELGVCKPDCGSNTFLFYQSGSRGVCVEADVSLINKIKAVRGGDIVVNAGVGVEDEEEVDFYIFNEPSLNTMNKAEAEHRVSLGKFKINRIVKIKSQNINTIIKKNFSAVPELLSIDIEGMDMVVLKTLDFERYPVPVICVETCVYNESHIKPKDLSIQEFLRKKGYFIYADTYINTIFVNQQWFYGR